MEPSDLIKSSVLYAKAESVLAETARIRTVYLTLIVWAISIYMLSGLNLPAVVINILCLLTGIVFGLFIEVWHLSRRLEAAIILLKLNGYRD